MKARIYDLEYMLKSVMEEEKKTGIKIFMIISLIFLMFFFCLIK